MGRPGGPLVMRSVTSARRRTRTAIVAAIVGLALALRMAFVPLHLAWNDHVLLDASVTHVHVHEPLQGDDGHRHGSEHSPSDDPRSDHEPHPVADHLEPLVVPATPTFAHADLAPAPSSFTISSADEAECVSGRDPESRPRPPPPRDTAPARAPPIVA